MNRNSRNHVSQLYFSTVFHFQLQKAADLQNNIESNKWKYVKTSNVHIQMFSKSLNVRFNRVCSEDFKCRRQHRGSQRLKRKNIFVRGNPYFVWLILFLFYKTLQSNIHDERTLFCSKKMVCCFVQTWMKKKNMMKNCLLHFVHFNVSLIQVFKSFFIILNVSRCSVIFNVF